MFLPIVSGKLSKSFFACFFACTLRKSTLKLNPRSKKCQKRHFWQILDYFLLRTAGELTNSLGNVHLKKIIKATTPPWENFVFCKMTSDSPKVDFSRTKDGLSADNRILQPWTVKIDRLKYTLPKITTKLRLIKYSLCVPCVYGGQEYWMNFQEKLPFFPTFRFEWIFWLGYIRKTV